MVVRVIDLSIIAIIAFGAWRGYRNGLIRGVFGLVALVVSLFAANVAATAYSEEFTGMLRPFISGIVETTLVNMRDDGVTYKPSEHDHVDTSEEFGTAYTVLRQLGLPEASSVRVAELALEAGAGGTGGVGVLLADIIADKLSSVFAFVAVFGIAFILLAIVFAVIGNLIGFVFSLPGLKGLRIVDAVTGVLLGAAKGWLIVLALTAIVRYFGLLASSTLEETAVLSYFVNNNAIADMLGL